MLFRDTIGFVQRSKYIKTRPNFKNSMAYRRIGDSFRLKIKHIEYSQDTVYDFHVPLTHSFISNGFISHNTGRLSSASPNLMNIPSHATDIRHLFRATAAQRHSDKVKCEDDTIKISLPTCSKIIIDDKKIGIDDLQVGDTLSLISKEGDRQNFKVDSNENANGTVTVTLRKE